MSVTSTSAGSPGRGAPSGARASIGVAFTRNVSDGAAHAATASACRGVPGSVSVHVYQPGAAAVTGGVVAVPRALGVGGDVDGGLTGGGGGVRAVGRLRLDGEGTPEPGGHRAGPAGQGAGDGDVVGEVVARRPGPWAAAVVTSLGVSPVMVALAVALRLVRGAAPTVRCAAWSGEPRSA